MHGTIESIFRVEWRPLAELAAATAEWRALADRTLEPNVFYDPAFALAAAPLFGSDAGAGLVWSRTSPPALLGLFPARIERRRYGVPFPILCGWCHPYAPLGTPLVDHRYAEAAIAAWFDYVERDPVLPKRLLMPLIPSDGKLAEAFEAAIAGSGSVSIAYGRHERAMLAPQGDRTTYVDCAIGHKKRKELRRQLRRLGESGSITFETACEPETIGKAISQFLALEASGWKGRAGTAARQHADISVFIETAVRDLARNRNASIARLLLDGRIIAALVLLKNRDTVWAWKIAYDESFARASPGAQILLHATETLLDDQSMMRADSCAAANHPLIDHIWRERLDLADRLIRIGPNGRALFAVAQVLESSRRGAVAYAKRLRDLIGRR